MTTPVEQNPRVAIVTGGSGGMGSAVARRLAADGQSVLVQYAGGRDRAEQVVAAITAAGGIASMAQADVADESDVANLFDLAEQRYGGIDVVVNTAGIMLLSPLVDQDFEVFDRMHRVNVRGTFVVSQQAARRVRAGGAIINLSSSIPKLATMNYSAYAATKGAVDAMTLILARELRGRDITVNAIGAGPTDTPLFINGKPQSVIDTLAKISPFERLGLPEDVAELASFLAGPGRWINGQVVYSNGGAI